MAAKKSRLFLIDGTAIAYRAYFAMMQRPLSATVDGKNLNTSAIYGFTQSLLKILEEEKPEYIAVAFDSSEPTFRHKTYEDYKATREKMPDDMVDQLPFIEEMVKAMNIPFLVKPGLEADDIIASLAMRANDEGLETYIVSGDKDFMQLVNEHTFLFSPAKGATPSAILGSKEVEKKLGVQPSQVVDYLSLVGDSSDNVPGVPGVGPKTATKLIKEYGSIDKLIDCAEKGEIENAKMNAKLKQHRHDMILSRDLIRLDTPRMNGISFDELKTEAFNVETMSQLLKKLEFHSLEKRLAKSGPDGHLQSENESKSEEIPQTQVANAGYQSVTSEEGLKSLLDNLLKEQEFVFDLETTSLNPFEATVVGIAFCARPGQAHYVDLRENQQWLKTLLKSFFATDSKHVAKGGHNIKYDLLVLKAQGISVANVAFDSMIESYLLDANLRRHSLDTLALKHFDHHMIPISDLIGKGKKQISMAEVDLDRVTQYACEDADYSLKLHTKFKPLLEKQELSRVYHDIEIPLVEVLCDMEFHGVKIDVNALQKLSEKLDKSITKLEQKIYKLCGCEFNIQSPQQLGNVLFETLEIHKEMKLKRVKKTKTGYSTNAAVLESLAPHPVAEAILEFRNLAKLRSTYVDALPKLVEEKTGRVHTNFNQTVTATGRLSSSDPNLQNIPIRTEQGREIRRAFIAPQSDWILLSADYSQIELRLLAHMSGDEHLIKAFKRDADIHAETAAKIFGLKPEEVDATTRNRAKAINFGVLYGMGPTRLARETGVSMSEASTFIEEYFAAFPSVRELLDSLVEFGRSQGYCKTLLGRRRELPDIHSKNPGLQAEAERIAVNTPIQGTAADLIKIAMIDLQHRLYEGKWKANLILQVHDELMLELPEEEKDPIKQMVIECMQNAMALSVPLKVEVGTGQNWLEAH